MIDFKREIEPMIKTGIFPVWTVNQIITPDEAGDISELYGLHIEASIYRTPGICKPFAFDGCSAINNFLHSVLPPKEYAIITQHICRPHDLVYGVCTSTKRRAEADEKFKADLLATGFISAHLCEIAYKMVREFGATNKTWGPGFALNPGFGAEVK